MADKKTTKKTEETLSLPEQLVAKRKDLLDARKSLAGGELVNPRVIRAYRKDIARVKTAINQGKEKK